VEQQIFAMSQEHLLALPQDGLLRRRLEERLKQVDQPVLRGLWMQRVDVLHRSGLKKLPNRLLCERFFVARNKLRPPVEPQRLERGQSAKLKKLWAGAQPVPVPVTQSVGKTCLMKCVWAGKVVGLRRVVR
jgi:hypothetical protein